MNLTEKQQIRVRAGVFRALDRLKFKWSPNGYWWKEIYGTRVCVGFDVNDSLRPGTKTGNWCWQTSELDKEPLFGMSGSTHIGAKYGTFEKVIDCTLEIFYSVGFSKGVAATKKETYDRLSKSHKLLTEALQIVTPFGEQLPMKTEFERDFAEEAKVYRRKFIEFKQS